MTEYQVTFQKGNRVGARSFRTVVVNAETEEEAIRLAKIAFKRDYPDAQGYRFSSIFS